LLAAAAAVKVHLISFPATPTTFPWKREAAQFTCFYFSFDSLSDDLTRLACLLAVVVEAAAAAAEKETH